MFRSNLFFGFLEISFTEAPVAKFNKLCEPDILQNINFVLWKRYPFLIMLKLI